MSRFEGSLRLPEEEGPGLNVTLDLDREKIVITSPGGVIGEWPMSAVGIRGEDDGFHLRVEGEEVVITTDDDAGFALAIGLTSASPVMRRKIASALRS